MLSVEHWNAYIANADQVVLGRPLPVGHVKEVLNQYAATHSMPNKMSSPSDVPRDLVDAIYSLRAMSIPHEIHIRDLSEGDRNIRKEIFSLLQARSSASEQTESVDVVQSRPLHVDMGGGAKKFLGMTHVPFE